MIDGSFGSQCHLKVTVRAARESTTTSNRNYLTAAIRRLNTSHQQIAATTEKWEKGKKDQAVQKKGAN